MMSDKDKVESITELAALIRPLLAGREPDVVGAALADLLAMLLAGHFAEEEIGSPHRPATDGVREELLQLHIEMVRKLIPINEGMILEGLGKAK
jgi:hypothetical protein